MMRGEDLPMSPGGRRNGEKREESSVSSNNKRCNGKRIANLGLLIGVLAGWLVGWLVAAG